MNINIWAVLAAAVSAFLLGGAWYSPLLFGRAWQRAAGLSEEQLKAGNPAVVFGGSLVLSLVAAFVFAMFLGPNPAMTLALGWGKRLRASRVIEFSLAGERAFRAMLGVRGIAATRRGTTAPDVRRAARR